MAEAEIDLLSDELETAIVSRGAVLCMNLPEGWLWGKRKSRDESQFSFLEFHPDGKPTVMLWFFYRGQKLNDTAAHSFRNLLAQLPHLLTPQEISAVSAVVREKGKPEFFELISARTEQLNGKMVLQLQGRYKAGQEGAYSLYIDSDGTGSTVQELHFQAHKDEYRHYINEARKSFSSIIWRPTNASPTSKPLT
jgi:hypothetical protein